MFRATLCSAAVLVVLAGGSARGQVPAPPPPPPPPPGGARDVPLKPGNSVIRGRVVAAGTTTPVSRVEVRVTSAESTSGKSATTDANGNYEIAGLPAGKFSVAASKQGYIRVAYGQTRPNGQGQVVTLADGQTVRDINFSLQRAGVVTGRIVDEFGDPVVDVQVMPMRLQYLNGERRMMPVSRPAMTNDLGEYRIYGLPAGEYYITATLRGMMMGDTDDRSGYAPTYYPGTGNVAEAQRLAVAPAQTISGLNMTLLPVRTSRVSGTAHDSDGRPIAGAMVMAMERTGAGMFIGMVRAPAMTRPDGSFTLSGLMPGEYILRVGMPGVDAPEVATQVVTVSSGDVSGVQLTAAKASTIRGRILVEQGTTPPRASSFGIGSFSPMPMMGGGQAHVNDDYTFEIRTMAGHQSINLRPEGDWRIHSVRLNGVDVTDSGIDVPPNSVVSEVTVEVTTHMPEVTGKVVDDRGQPIRDVWVVIFATDSLRWGTPTRWVASSRPDLNNTYRLRVPAGDYFLIALDDVQQGEWADPEYLSRARDSAMKISIAEGEKKSIDLTLPKERKP